jgi:hypothetical protein
MQLFTNKNKKLHLVEEKPFKLEKDIQQLVENNSETLLGLEFIGTEITVDKYRIDSLCFDSETNSFVIVEYKKGSSYSVIDQGYTYLQLLLNNKSDFILIYSEYLEKVVKSKDIDWSQSRIIFISQSFNNYQKDSVNFKDLPFELWEISRYSDDQVALNKHISTSTESVKTISAANSKNYRAVTEEIKSYDEQSHIKDFDKKLQENWINFRELMMQIDGMEMNIIKRYIAFTMGFRKSICYCNTQANGFRIDIVRGSIKNGKKSKNFLTLDDPKQMAKENSWTWKNGDTGHKYEVKFDKNTDIDYLVFLLNQQVKKFK